jgi:hypothetical protein
MSYDVYCYRPTSDIPDVGEARTIVEQLNLEEEEGRSNRASSEIKEKIAAALIEHNPRLERFRFKYEEIAKATNISKEEAASKYQHIELNPPEGDLAIQLIIYEDHLLVTMPYWYAGNDAHQLFSSLSDYLAVIGRTAGLFTYDPQTDQAFDPTNTRIEDHEVYEKIVGEMPKIAAASAKQKKWWKFW